MVEETNEDLWDIAHSLDATNFDLCKAIDPRLASKINSMEDLLDIYWYICYGNMHSILSHTREKVNEIWRSEFQKEGDRNWWQVKRFTDWFDEDLRSILTKKWLDGDDDFNIDAEWMVSSLPSDSETSLKVLDKLIRNYKKKRSSDLIKLIEDVFVGIDSDYIDKGCELISKGTPAISVTMLKRTDIKEKYTLKGLKSLSKLSKQKDMDIKIDFDMLKNLGPKARLDAMKQLMGMFDEYYKFKQTQSPSQYGYSWKEKRLKSKAKTYSLPFNEMPNRSEIETFLFPCALRYNEEVKAMVKRFDELTNQKEEL